ncbi:MAG TPA: AraC family transcriptional regulator [Candidatus Avimuribaculum pullicola]|nr:AraC family transcriptional regulator [Candidatus Avimuribaculum pullicola]
MGRSQYTDIQSNDFKDFISVHYSDSDLSVCFNLSDSVRGDKAISLDSFLFMACIDGEISGEVDANRYTLRPNNIIVCRPNRQMSNISSTDNFKCIAITVSQQMLLSILPMNERLFNSNIHFAGYPVVNIDDSTDAERLRTYYSLLKSEAINNGQRYRREIVLSLAMAAIHKMLYLIDKYLGINGNGQLKQSEILFGRFIELLSNSDLKERTVNFYAEKLCITPKYLSVVCKRTSGKTASDWINEFVVKEIKKQLRHSSKSIKEIALDLDFPNLSFFGKYVKAHLGLSPTQYRKKLFE